LFAPENPLAPADPVFDAPWQAQALALADTLARSGRFTPADWAEALGHALREADAQGAPDTTETYYGAVLIALERLSETHAGISAAARTRRRAEWEAAYRRTPHGRPVVLGDRTAPEGPA